jgi:hypothetical protein
VVNQGDGADEDVPKWDVALASLARDTCAGKGRPLTIDDFTELAREHAIRFDDIMVTMFELVIQGEWRYRETGGTQRAITRKTLEELFVRGRLNRQDVNQFTGEWSPA